MWAWREPFDAFKSRPFVASGQRTAGNGKVDRQTPRKTAFKFCGAGTGV
jgi:hypothetical protein